ncbi:MAG: PDZ domain-containing protein [Betaproteobacteria bacterium]|nr:PDZ domain-containing protein [Betaproteobacteria bacterium]
MKVRSLLSLAALGAATLHLGGCASIVGGHNQPLSVTTPGCQGAACELTNDKGKWYVPATPGTVSIRRSYSDLLVACTREGAPPASASVKSTTKPLAFGNIIFGGIIGAGVDIGTGAAYDYPSEVTVPMGCQPTANATAGIPQPQPRNRLECVVKDMNPDLAESAGLEASAGVLVTAVAPEGAAARSGIKAGDVLLEVNDTPIMGTAALREALATHDTTRPARLRLWRNRQPMTIEVQLHTEGAV